MSDIKVRHPIIISFSAGATLNIGNYQSVKVNLGLSVPVYDAKKIDETYLKIVKKIEKLLDMKVEEYTQKYSMDTADEILLEEE